MNTQALGQTKRTRMSAPSVRSRESKSKTQDDSRIPSIVRKVVHSQGQPLDAATRGFMEPRFDHHFSRVGVVSTANRWRGGEQEISRPGDSFEEQAERLASAALRTDERAQAEPSRHFDFSAVKIHTDSIASASARAINAHAYTLGNHIVFGQGKFDPKSTAGRGLLAHELAHVAQMRGRPTSERVPLLRQRAEESEDERRRQALESLNWLEAIPPIVMDDNAPALIAWARTQAMKFEAPETSDDKRHYLARGLLRVHKQLQEFETRAKRNPQGALVYTDILRDTQTLWTEDGARSLDAIEPFTPSNIGEWKIAAKSPRASARLGKQKKEKAQKQAAERPEPRRDAEKVTFRKQKGMTFNTEEGQRQIAMYLMATIQSRSSMNELAAAVSQVDLSKWWAPPTGGDLPTWQQEFETTDVGSEFTMVVSGKFIAEIGDLMMRGPKERDFMIEAVRRGVVESKYGLYLGVGTFVVGASALTGGAFLGTMLAPGGGLATGGVLSGGGLLGGGVGQSARAVGTYLTLNAPELYGSAMLYGGAVVSGLALGSHVQDIRSEGWQGWRREVPRFIEDVQPGISGYAEYSSMRLGGGGGNIEEVPGEGGGLPPGATRPKVGDIISPPAELGLGPQRVVAVVPEGELLTPVAPMPSASRALPSPTPATPSNPNVPTPASPGLTVPPSGPAVVPQRVVTAFPEGDLLNPVAPVPPAITALPPATSVAPTNLPASSGAEVDVPGPEGQVAGRPLASTGTSVAAEGEIAGAPGAPSEVRMVSPSAELNVPGPHPFFKKPAANENQLLPPESQIAKRPLASTGTGDVAPAQTVGPSEPQGGLLLPDQGAGGTIMAGVPHERIPVPKSGSSISERYSFKPDPAVSPSELPAEAESATESAIRPPSELPAEAESATESAIPSDARTHVFESDEWGGYHSEARYPEGNPNIKIAKVRYRPDANGVYKVKLEIKDPSTGAVIRTKDSTMFPKDWTEQKILDETSAVMRANPPGPPNAEGLSSAKGRSPSGVTIKIDYVNGEVKSFYPIHSKDL